MSYDTWLNEVDQAVRDLTALELAIFNDYPLADCYAAGIPPPQAAIQVVSADPFGQSLLKLLEENS